MIEIQTKEYTFKIHSHVSETSFSDFCDFITFDQVVLKCNDNSDKAMIDAVCKLVPNAHLLPLSSHGSDKPGYTYDLSKRISVHDLYLYYSDLWDNYFENTIMPAIDNLSGDLSETQKHCIALVKNARGVLEKAKAVMLYTEYIENCAIIDNHFRFEYKGEFFYINPLRVRNYFGGHQYTAGEVSEVKEFRKKLEAYAATQKNYDQGLLMFRIRLRDMAVLARKKGETLPYDAGERDSFINERMDNFQELPMDIVFNVCFFLISSLQSVIQTSIIKNSGMKITNGGMDSTQNKLQSKKPKANEYGN